MRVGAVVVVYCHARFSKMNSDLKDKIEQFNLGTVVKDILDNHCSEWTMDGGNSWSMG
jgi:hypothetical protein